MVITGKNPDIVIYWNCSAQMYTVFNKGKVIASNKYKFSEVESYLD